MKGQFFSFDFVVAILILTIALGLFIQNFEIAQKNTAAISLTFNPAESIAEQIVYACKDDAIAGCPSINNYNFRFYYYPPEGGGDHYYSTQDMTGDPSPVPCKEIPAGAWATKGTGPDESGCANVFSARRITSCPCGEHHKHACFLEVKTCG